MGQNDNMKSISQASALSFAITYNLWLPMYCSHYFANFNELLVYVIIPLVILWLIYYILALKVKLFYEKWQFNRNNVIAILILQFAAGILLYFFPLKITIMCLIGLCGFLFFLYCKYNKLAIK